jgi:nucleoside-diphosphate-sugar epimerase
MNSAGGNNEARLLSLTKEKPLVSQDETIAVFGAGGQVGHALRPLLDTYYPGRVAYCDAGGNAKKNGFADLDITDEAKVTAFLKERNVKAVINLAALLSVATTAKPGTALNVNLWAAIHLMKSAQECGVRKVQIMSSMAAQEFDAKPGDSAEVVAIKKTLQKQAATSLLARPDSRYGLQKLGMEIVAELYSRHYGLDVSVPRLAGVTNCHLPWPSDGTTEELDKLVVACAEHAVYGEQAPHLKGGKYFPEVPADTTFDMVDCRTLMPVVFMMLHEDLRPSGRNLGVVHNISEYTVSMGEAAAILKEAHPAFPVEFSPEAVDPGKAKHARIWATSQDTRSTEQLIGGFKQYSARQSILDHFERVKLELQNDSVSAAKAV